MQNKDKAPVDLAPFEFLFGNLSLDRPVENPVSPLKINLRLAIIYFFYACNMLLVVNFFYGHVISFNWFYLPFLLFFSVFLTAMKNVYLTKKYASDLLHENMKTTKFAIVQVFISYLCSGIAVLFVGIVLFFITDWQITQLYLLIIIILLIIIYSKLSPDLGIASLGLGMSILPAWGSIKHKIQYFIKISAIKGKFSSQLALSRLGLLFIYVLLFGMKEIWLLPIFACGFIYFFIKWEKMNASSLFLQIRSIVQYSTPVSIPSILKNSNAQGQINIHRSSTNQGSFNPPPTELNPENRSFKYKSANRSIDHNIFPTKSNKQSIFQNRPLADITPVAARAMNRIVDSIKKEVNSSSLMYYCKVCDIETNQFGKFCQQCGNLVENYNYA